MNSYKMFLNDKNNKKMLFLFLTCILFLLIYLFINVKFSNYKLLKYTVESRMIKIITIIIVAITIGSASLIFQTVIDNRLVTPCLLGCNTLYTLIHTLIVFFVGVGSVVYRNQNLNFFIDLIFMIIVGLVIYGYLFKKTNYNILFILLVGTVLNSFFTSVQNTLVRVLEPNDYDALLSTLVASFNNINKNIIIFSIISLIVIFSIFYKELKLLNVLSLGKVQSINLGIEYEVVIRKLLILVVLLISISTAMIGPLSFLGLIIANLSRQFLKTFKHLQLVFVSILFGLLTITGCQILVEHVFNYSIPVSTFITIFGGVYFLYLLLVQRKE